MTDRMSIKGLKVRGHHGVFAEERADGQDFWLDVTLELDTSRAGETDELDDTIDYGALAVRLAEIVAGEPVQLIERLAALLAEACLDDPRVAAAEITVHKPQAPIPLPFDDVSVAVRRERR